MKKKVLGLALVAMSLTAITGMAQNTSATDTTPRKENVKSTRADKKEARKQKADLFEGITLTETQKSQLEQLDSKRKAAREEQKKAREEQKKQRKEQAQSGNGTKADKNSEAAKQRKDARIAERRTSKKSYLDEVKAIIGPQNYMVFLENMYVNGSGQKSGRHALAKGKDGKSKDFRKGHGKGRGNRKNNRGDKNQNKGDQAFNRPAKQLKAQTSVNS